MVDKLEGRRAPCERAVLPAGGAANPQFPARVARRLPTIRNHAEQFSKILRAQLDVVEQQDRLCSAQVVAQLHVRGLYRTSAWYCKTNNVCNRSASVCRAIDRETTGRSGNMVAARCARWRISRVLPIPQGP
jgi:spore germination cell wall hydrolase CwlJ-like protein